MLLSEMIHGNLRPTPAMTAKPPTQSTEDPNMWAAGIVYAIAQNCYLVGNRYDIMSGKPKYHFTSDEIASAFGVSKGSMSAKAKAIRDDLGITNVKNEWLHPDMREMNTMMNNLRRAIGIKL